MIFASGVLFVTPNGKALFLKRAPDGTPHAGEWCLPGGHIEAGETAEEAARRECEEEIGYRFKRKDDLVIWTRRQAEDVDFTTFILRVEDEFTPTLNNEHTGWAWASLLEPPEPLHPGCRVIIDRFGMDELGIARAIASGELTSPQQYQNVWLFDLRVTGTGAAYRVGRKEFCWRPPEDYLTQDFLDRCNGLAVVWVHPKGEVLDSKEYGERSIGSIMLPYIKGDEVWGIAKIYDDKAIEEMRTKQLSTSPGVRGVGDNRVTLTNGSTVLIEEKPRLLDHLAVIPNGVWDKLGEPSGVASVLYGDEDMADNVNDAQQNGAAPAWATQLLSRIDEIGTGVTKLATRVDSMEETMTDRARKDEEDEKTRKDAEEKMRCDAEEEEKKAEEAKKDADEKDAKEAVEKAKEAGEEEKKEEKKASEEMKADSSRKDAQISELTTQTASMAKQIAALMQANQPVPEDALVELSGLQSRADSTYQLFGDRAPQAMRGETSLAFRRRLLQPLIKHSPAWKDVGYEGIAVMPEKAFAVAEKAVYADAQVAANSPSGIPAGQLLARSRTVGGHTITEYHGSPSSWMGDISGRSRLGAAKFNTSLGA